MSREKIPFVLPTDLGLDLASPVSRIEPGRLVRAQNKAARVWGPRHGMSFVDRESRGRAHPDLNGTSSFVTLPYNPIQFALTARFSLRLVFQLGTVRETFLVGRDASSFAAFDIAVDASDKVVVRLDDGANTATLTSVSSVEADRVYSLAVVREGSSSRLFLDGFLQDSDLSLGATLPLEISTDDILVGKPAAYSAADWWDGVFGGLYLVSHSEYNSFYDFSELPGPRGPDVLGAWTGELLESDALVRDASRMANHGVGTDLGSGNRITEVHEPVQFVGHFTTQDGRERNVVVVGGQFFSEVV